MAFYRFEVRVLELDYPTTSRLHIRDVSFAVLGDVHDFLPSSGKLVFPRTVPCRFVLQLARDNYFFRLRLSFLPVLVLDHRSTPRAVCRRRRQKRF